MKYSLVEFFSESEERGIREGGWKPPGKGALTEMPMLSDEAGQCVLLRTVVNNERGVGVQVLQPDTWIMCNK